MVGDIVGAGVIVVDIVGATAVVAADWIWFSSKTMVVRPPVRVVQVIWPTVNVRPSVMEAEAGMMTILFVWRAIRTPPTWRATVDESWSAVYLGVYPR